MHHPVLVGVQGKADARVEKAVLDMRHVKNAVQCLFQFLYDHVGEVVQGATTLPTREDGPLALHPPDDGPHDGGFEVFPFVPADVKDFISLKSPLEDGNVGVDASKQPFPEFVVIQLGGLTTNGLICVREPCTLHCVLSMINRIVRIFGATQQGYQRDGRAQSEREDSLNGMGHFYSSFL